VQKIGIDGAAMTAVEHQDEFFLRTTGGVIMDDKGGQRIWSLKLRSGCTAFRLVSDSNPKIVTVVVSAVTHGCPRRKFKWSSFRLSPNTTHVNRCLKRVSIRAGRFAGICVCDFTA
jgi:hypothetical protein